MISAVSPLSDRTFVTIQHNAGPIQIGIGAREIVDTEDTILNSKHDLFIVFSNDLQYSVKCPLLKTFNVERFKHFFSVDPI